MSDDEALDRVRALCLALDGAAEASLQDRPLFHVRRRRFAIFNGEDAPFRRRWASAGRSLHVLVDDDDRLALLADARCAPSPHHGDRGWVQVRLDDDTDWDEIAELVASAHALVVSAPSDRGRPGRRAGS